MGLCQQRFLGGSSFPSKPTEMVRFRLGICLSTGSEKILKRKPDTSRIFYASGQDIPIRSASVAYSMLSSDQPGSICELDRFSDTELNELEGKNKDQGSRSLKSLNPVLNGSHLQHSFDLLDLEKKYNPQTPARHAPEEEIFFTCRGLSAK